MPITKSEAEKMRVFETYNLLKTSEPDKKYVNLKFRDFSAIAHKDKGGSDKQMDRVLKGRKTLLD